MEKLILGTRKQGKTKRLIELCHKNGYSIIVCPNRAKDTELEEKDHV